MTYLLLLFFALLIFIGGAGINCVTYCCVECQDTGLEAVLQDKCCKTHEHKHMHCDTDSKSSSLSAFVDCMDSTSCCQIQRIQFDWSQGHIPVVDLTPIVLELFQNRMVPSLSSFLSLLEENRGYAQKDRWLSVPTPRVYLSLLTTLLI